MCPGCWAELQELLWLEEWDADDGVVSDVSVEVESSDESIVSSTASTLPFADPGE